MDTIQAHSGGRGMVSRKSPDPCRVKHVYCGLDIVELCVYDAVANIAFPRVEFIERHSLLHTLFSGHMRI